MKSDLGRLAHHSAIYAAALVTSKALVLLLLPIYSRKLDPEAFGVYSLLLTTAAVVSGVLSLGLGTAVLRHAVLEPGQNPHRFYVTALVWHAVLAALVLPLGWWAAPSVAGWLLGGTEHARLVFLAVLTATLTTLGLSPASVLRFEERSTVLSLLRTGQNALLGAFNVVILLVLGWGVMGLLLSEVVVAAAFLTALLVATRRALDSRFSFTALGELVRYGLPLVPATLSMTALLAADRYFLNGLGYARELGLYSVAYRFGFLIYLLVSAIQTAWPPIMYAAQNAPDAARRFARLYTLFMAGFVGVGVALALFSPPLLALLTPPTYWEGARVVPLVVSAYVLHAAYAIIGNAIYKSGRTTRLALALGVATAVNIALNAVLIPGHGMIGAAWATLGAYVVLVVLVGVLAHADFPVPYEWGRLSRIALAGALAVTAGTIGRGALDATGTWARAAGGTTLYVVLLSVLGIVGRKTLSRLRELGGRGG